MVDFISEVEEELRKDDYNRLLKKYGPLILGVIVLIVAGTGYNEYRKYASDRVARSAAASYVAADRLADEGEVDRAVASFEQLSAAAPEGYSGLSLMRAAALKSQDGDILAAVGYYDRAAQVFSRPRHSDLAKLKAAYLLADNGAYEDVRVRIEPLAVKDTPYEFLARELLAYAAQSLGDVQTARSEYSYLESVPGVPPTIKERASQSLGLITAGDTKVETPPAPVTDPTPTLPDTDGPSETGNDAP